MKAVVCTKYGAPEVLQFKEEEKPIPKANEVLVRILASSVTAADGMMRKGTSYFGRLFIGLFKPKNPISGTGFSGVVEGIGKNVTSFCIDDLVFGESVFGSGTNAGYLCITEDGVLALKPNNITHEEAAPICDGALTSLNFLKDVAKTKVGQKVLINGASGSLGTAAIQLAKYFGAEVTGVCSTGNIALVKSLGADFVMDYTQKDFTNNGEAYSVIYDTVGKASFATCKNSLIKDGVYISPVLSISLLFQMLWTSMFGSKKAKFSATGVRPIPELRILLNELVEIIELEKLRSVIDKTYPLNEIVKAHRYVDTGRKKGNVVMVPVID